MPVQISVGPPVITISQNDTFMVTDQNGEISRESEQGVFFMDTRFVSRYQVTANGHPWVRLSSNAVASNVARVHLTNESLATEHGEIAAGTIGLTITRAVADGIHEDIDVTNFSLSPARFNLELMLHSDFADLFEVKDHKFVQRGRIDTTVDMSRQELVVSYTNRDFRRSMVYHVLESGSAPRNVNGRITFDIDLMPGESWRLCQHLALYDGAVNPARVYECYFKQGQSAFEQLAREWRDQTTQLDSVNPDVSRAYRQSLEDMGGLRIHFEGMAPGVWLPAAGVPWFVTVFGRDSLIVSLQNMLVDPGFARGALQTLGRFQATHYDSYTDAEPGKILHEMRFGELAHFHRIPHTPYYGTHDATPLYLIVLHEAWKWLGDDALLHEYRDVALRCLDWIDKYGDIDGDGFQEYQTRSPKGYENMAWKDAGDAVVYPDGSQVKQPKALCELQGYVFDAWMRMAEVFDTIGEPERAAELRRKAAVLQRQFEERFWCEDIGYYAYGLDPNKQPIKTIASNPGHCLFSGIANPEHAAAVVKRMQEPDMWSGWGIRTLSALNPAFNPFSYQNGSVWPHDNGIIAMGFKRYGFANEAMAVARDVLLAGSYFVSYRFPELYAGVGREVGTFPVQYLGANVPQAWAAGSLFHFLQALLGLQADAPQKCLYVDPSLQEGNPEMTLRGLRVGNGRLDLHFWREGDKSRWEVLSKEGDIEVVQRPWRPWTAAAPVPPARRRPSPPLAA